MRIAIIVEGKTEKAFLPHLQRFLSTKLAGRMPNLDPFPYDGLIPSHEKLKRTVENLLKDRRNPADHVIALTDVYTGENLPRFLDAADAKLKMNQWVGVNPKFHPHVAMYDFEAWLIPYWEEIQHLAGHNRNAPNGDPERINHNNPPSYRIKELFNIGNKGLNYVKPRDAGRTLRDKDLMVSILQCAELKSFVNTIITCCHGTIIPDERIISKLTLGKIMEQNVVLYFFNNPILFPHGYSLGFSAWQYWLAEGSSYFKRLVIRG